VQVADYTNDSSSQLKNYDYEQLIGTKASNASGSGRFYQGATTGTSGAETGTSGYDPTNQITAGTGQNSRTSYTVQSGDTLQGIASNLWGDSSLWYKIADANGLGADSALTAGQALSVPLSGPSNFNNAGMFRPYDAASAVGDLSPTQAKPPKSNKCGAFGQILLVAIAVAVSAPSHRQNRSLKAAPIARASGRRGVAHVPSGTGKSRQKGKHGHQGSVR
jgi:LysM repeat protein